MMRFRPWSALLVVTLGLVFLNDGFTQSSRAQSAPRYTLIDLGTLGGASTQAADINNSGQITGYATSATSQARAFKWLGGQMTDLGSLGNASFGNDINGHGDVVGLSSMATGPGRAALWQNGTITNLTPDLPNTVASTATAINDADEVLIHFGGNAFVWRNGTRQAIGGLGGGSTHPADINNAGQIVGSSYTTVLTPLGFMQHAFLWESGAITDLGVLPGDEDSGASAINEQGVIVGSSGRTDPETYESSYRPFIYQHGTMTAIPAPSFEAYAGDINAAGVVVGTMRAGGGPTPWNAWVYINGVVSNLNALKPAGTGLHLAYANAINDAGQITGVAMDAQGRYHGFLLTPCDPCGPPPVVPSISITDVTRTEGNSGTSNFAFTVSLSQATTGMVRVNFMTANLIAIAGVDFNFAHGTLIFAPGETAKVVNVAVRGDRSREQDETFRVNLSAADGGILFDSFGLGIIRNDDR